MKSPEVNERMKKIWERRGYHTTVEEILKEKYRLIAAYEAQLEGTSVPFAYLMTDQVKEAIKHKIEEEKKDCRAINIYLERKIVWKK